MFLMWHFTYPLIWSWYFMYTIDYNSTLWGILHHTHGKIQSRILNWHHLLCAQKIVVWNKVVKIFLRHFDMCENVRNLSHIWSTIYLQFRTTDKRIDKLYFMLFVIRPNAGKGVSDSGTSSVWTWRLSKTEVGKLFVGGGHTVKEWSRTEIEKTLKYCGHNKSLVCQLDAQFLY